MIKREHIKQAIEAIASRDKEMGYVLDELLGSGRIRVPEPDREQETFDPIFYLDNDKIIIKRISFFLDGLVPIEQRLVVKFGEFLKKEEIQESGKTIDFLGAVQEIQMFGLDLLVQHEILYALKRLKDFTEASPCQKRSDHIEKVQNVLESMQRDEEKRGLGDQNCPEVIYTGVVNIDTPAVFMHFPYCFEALRQVSELNLEFFHVRFVLDCLLCGEGANLYACVVDGHIVGLCYICARGAAFSHEIEIKYLATVRGLKEPGQTASSWQVRGVGTFLIAGIWMLWKSRLIQAKGMVLDAEIESRQFYESLGFVTRGPMAYVLKLPRGYLLLSILNFLFITGIDEEQVLKSVRKAVLAEIRFLTRRSKDEASRKERKIVLNLLVRCLQTNISEDLFQAIVASLHKSKGKIPEAYELLKMVSSGDLIQMEQGKDRQEAPLWIVHDSRFAKHLEGIFHLESPKRCQVINEILFHESLSRKWQDITPRPASREELLLVHTPEYIDTIARSSGSTLTTFDLDTQATAQSFDTAILAAGSVMALLETIWTGQGTRGFAFVRPPGHHAEPDKAMGFCLFNNIALGCEFLRTYFDLDRIMIIDIDAHHGNGIQKIFYATDKVLYLSFHQFPAYPGTGKISEVGQDKGEGFTINVPLHSGQNEADYCRYFHWLVRPVARAYQPEILVIACGFDLYCHDMLTKMNVSPEGYGQITEELVNIAEEVCQGRIVFVMEGGYSLEGIQACGLKTVQALCLPRKAVSQYSGMTMNLGSLPSPLKKVFEIHKKYWQCLR
jgi:acetoin utilization deacetylase AcuC-like enzyme